MKKPLVCLAIVAVFAGYIFVLRHDLRLVKSELEICYTPTTAELDAMPNETFVEWLKTGRFNRHAGEIWVLEDEYLEF